MEASHSAYWDGPAAVQTLVLITLLACVGATIGRIVRTGKGGVRSTTWTTVVTLSILVRSMLLYVHRDRTATSTFTQPLNSDRTTSSMLLYVHRDRTDY